MSRRQTWLPISLALLVTVFSIAASGAHRPAGGAGIGPAVAAAALPRDLAPAALAAIQAGAGPEYAATLSPDDPGVRLAAAGNDLQVAYDGDAVTLAERTPRGVAWRLRMRLTAAGYGDALAPVGAGETVGEANRVEYRRPGLTEWYVSGPLGLEQGFTLDEPLPGRAPGRPLTLALALGEGFAAEEAGDALVLRGPRGARLRYGHLYAYDAAGRALPAWLEAAPGQARIRVDDRDAVYPVTIDPLVQKQRLNAADESTTGQNGFGISVSVSDGTAVVGAYLTEAAYVFIRRDSVWLQQAKLTASDGASGDWFGANVAIFGNTAIIGAPAKDGLDGGAYVFTRSGATWSQQQILSPPVAGAQGYFGSSVGIYRNTVVVGAAMQDALIGAAYVFTRQDIIWTLRDTLGPSAGATDGQFGAAVAISGTSILVGAPDEDASIGAAYVFLNDGGSLWPLQQKLLPSDPDGVDGFGNAVALDQDSALVATCGCESATYAFARSGGVWTETQMLLVSGADPLDGWGASLALVGNTAVIGGDGVNTFTGAAAVFTRSGGTWSQTTILTALEGQAGDVFGVSVAIERDASLIFVGAPADCGCGAPGAAHVFVQGPVTGEIVSPTPGTMLTDSSVQFNWTSVTGAQAYYLLVGVTGGGGQEIYSAAQGTATSRSVPMGYFFTGEPVGPNTQIYVRLLTNFGGSDWRQMDYTFITSPTYAGQTLTVPARISSPAQGSTFSSDTPTFTWNASPGAVVYCLLVGTTPGGSYDIYKNKSIGTTNATVPMTFRATGLPVPPDTPVYVRLLTNYGGSDWVQINYSFITAPDGSGKLLDEDGTAMVEEIGDGAAIASQARPPVTPGRPAPPERPLPPGVSEPPGVDGAPGVARDAQPWAPLPPGVSVPQGLGRRPGIAPAPTGRGWRPPAARKPRPPRPVAARTPHGLPHRPGATRPRPAMTPMVLAGTVVGAGGPSAIVRVQALVGTVLCGEAKTDRAGRFELAVMSSAQRKGCGAPGATVDLRVEGGPAQQRVPFAPGARRPLAQPLTAPPGAGR